MDLNLWENNFFNQENVAPDSGIIIINDELEESPENMDNAKTCPSN